MLTGVLRGKAVKIRHRIGVLLMVCLSTVLVTDGGHAMPTVKEYASCAALTKNFPNGIAKSKSAARAAVVANNQRPRVSLEIYKANRRFDKTRAGYICNQNKPVSSEISPVAQAPVPQVPQQVANLTVVPKNPVRSDLQSDFFISWQIPEAVDVLRFTVNLSNGSSKTVYKYEGAATSPDVLTYTVNGFGPFATKVEISVVAVNSVGLSPQTSTSFTTPSQPKQTVTVEITAGTGDCSYPRFCYVKVSNSTGGTDVYSEMGSWTFEANPGVRIFAYVRAHVQPASSSVCTIKFDGVVASTQTTNSYSSAACDAYVPR